MKYTDDFVKEWNDRPWHLKPISDKELAYDWFNKGKRNVNGMECLEEQSIFTLICPNKSFQLKNYESPRGLRCNSQRPATIKIEMKRTYSFQELCKHIDYLMDLSCTMEQRKS